jgi:Cu(I)/Ag(I) efflux system membrane fusion protein
LLGVDASTGEINIAHEPIEALDWPGMAMVFSLADGVDLSAVEPGDAIGFGLEKRGDDYVVIDVHPLGTEQMQ